MKRTTLRNALAVSVLATVSSFASATPTFTFSEVSGFDSSEVPPGSVAAGVLYSGALDAGPAPVVGVSLSSQMTWQDGVTDPRRSHLLMNNPNPPGSALPNGAPLTSPGAWVDITELTHINNVIAQSFSWGPQDIWGRIVITDHEGGPAVVLDDTDTITITFTETLNQFVGNPGVCQFGNPFNPLAAACPDFFTFTVAGLASLPFEANNGSDWEVQFRLDPVCDNCVVDAGSVYTREGTTSTLTVQARIVCTEQDARLCDPLRVPEPSILTLIGLGLLGLGFTGWRRQRGNLV